jgi:tetratricopeptide (TPR) repeat protein
MAEVLHDYPDSATAFAGYALSSIRLKNWDALDNAARERLERNPDDEQVVMIRAMAASSQGDFTKSLELLRTRISNPKASMGLLNNYAWDGLFVSPAPSDMIEIGQRAARLSDNKDFSILHTLAAVYAEIGRPAEARKLILEGMDEIGLDEPNEAAWYVFGRIAEQYGQTDAAVSAYKRTKQKEPGGVFDSNSTWALAERRARVMGAHIE